MGEGSSMMDQIAHIQSRLAEFAAEISNPEAVLDLTIKAAGISVYCRPSGFGVGNASIYGNGATPDACIDDAIAKFREMRSRLRSGEVKKIAMRIIELTHEHGSVTLAQLRIGFPNVEALVDEATALANSMADSGPFSVQRDEAKSNHAEGEAA